MSAIWTESQRDAIDARQGTILISAAAGSGKTSVLVERATEMLLDTEIVTHADSLLIATFTKAAALEMKGRLEKKLYETLRANPKNRLLREQLLLLPQASIGTVHSFCAQVVREFFHVLDISPEFRILPDGQRSEMMVEAAEEALEEAFEAGGYDVLLDAFTQERDDGKLIQTVIKLYEYIQSHPFPEKWLSEKIRMFEEVRHASSVNRNETESGNVNEAESGNVNETESGNVNEAESGNVNETESGNVNEAESGNVNEAESGNVNETESGNVNEAESGTIYKIAKSPWGEVILQDSIEAITYAITLTRSALDILTDAGDMGEEKLHTAYYPAFESDFTQLIDLKKQMKNSDWDRICKQVKTFTFDKLKPVRGVDMGLKDKVTDARKEVKAIIKKLSPFFFSDQAECMSEIAEISVLLSKLSDLTALFTSCYNEKKSEKNMLDYNDLEHAALSLCVDEDGNRTKVAVALSERFEQIMVDEFQDINQVQEMLFRSISRDFTNVFMVGDVKQSIYSFRQAMPDLFLGFKDSFNEFNRKDKVYPASITLDRNFRSRLEVTESVNFIFSQLMSKVMGGIDYTFNEQLVYGANYSEKANCETEFYLIPRDLITSEPNTGGHIPNEIVTGGSKISEANTGETVTREDSSMEELEASFIARRILALMREGFTVSDHGEERPARFSDFCVLLRSANRYAENYAKEMRNCGVPAIAAMAGGFFRATEISVALSLLRVIDNPLQDIPLLAVLMSPIYGFSPDDMAKMRIHAKQEPMYISLLRASETSEMYKAFLNELQMFRSIAATMSSDAFISFLYVKTGYIDLVRAMENGKRRVMNLQLLQKYAREYEGNGYNGISGFIRFMDRLKRNNADLESAQSRDQIEDAVQIISIHKAKGLEFPVCILAGCGRGKVHERDDVILHPKLGLGVKLKDKRTGAKFTSMPRDAIGVDLSKRAAEEEMRILYVALTRAKEKLIIVSTTRKPEDLIRKQAMHLAEGQISAHLIKAASSVLQWLVLCALRHPDCKEFREIAGLSEDVILKTHVTPWKFKILQANETEESSLKVSSTLQLSSDSSVTQFEDVSELEQSLTQADAPLYKKIKERIAFQYAYPSLMNIPSKVTASELVRHRSQSDTLSRPAWLQEKGMTASERGTALHNYMQYCDFKKADLNPTHELLRLVQENYLTQEQAAAVDLSRVESFLNSNLGRRVQNAKEVKKELRFTATILAGDLKSNLSPNEASEPVILQGAVDCMFIEGDKVHIIDFKTDRIRGESELLSSYRLQIALYAKAMHQVTGKEIGDCYLYSMYLEKEIVCDWESVQNLY